MEWTVVTVMVVLAGLIASVVKPLVSLNTVITKLSASVDALAERINAFERRNQESHNRMYKRLDEDKDTLADHETRLTVIENRGAK